VWRNRYDRTHELSWLSGLCQLFASQAIMKPWFERLRLNRFHDYICQVTIKTWTHGFFLRSWWKLRPFNMLRRKKHPANCVSRRVIFTWSIKRNWRKWSKNRFFRCHELLITFSKINPRSSYNFIYRGLKLTLFKIVNWVPACHVFWTHYLITTI
jgi:hypothetical protein